MKAAAVHCSCLTVVQVLQDVFCFIACFILRVIAALEDIIEVVDRTCLQGHIIRLRMNHTLVDLGVCLSLLLRIARLRKFRLRKETRLHKESRPPIIY